MQNSLYHNGILSPINSSSSRKNQGSPPFTKQDVSFLSSTRITPNKLSPRYSLSQLDTPKLQTNRNQVNSNPSLIGRQHNSNSRRNSDAKSPVLKNGNEITNHTHQPVYGIPGLFPRVHFFKKDIPTPRRKKMTVLPAAQDPYLSYIDDITSRHEDHSNTICQDVSEPDIGTRSVLDALKEISRKRIQTEEDSEPEVTKRMKQVDFKKRDREESPPISDVISPSNPSAKKLCIIDPVYASSTSYKLFVEKGTKRKITLDEDEILQGKREKKVHNAETQTVVIETPHIELPVVQTVQSSTSEEEPIKISQEIPTDNEETPVFAPIKVFDDRLHEIHKKNKLSNILSIITGEEPVLLPLNCDDDSEEETEKTDETLKTKSPKHVHFETNSQSELEKPSFGSNTLDENDGLLKSNNLHPISKDLGNSSKSQDDDGKFKVATGGFAFPISNKNTPLVNNSANLSFTNQAVSGTKLQNADASSNNTLKLNSGTITSESITAPISNSFNVAPILPVKDIQNPLTMSKTVSSEIKSTTFFNSALAGSAKSSFVIPDNKTSNAPPMFGEGLPTYGVASNNSISTTSVSSSPNNNMFSTPAISASPITSQASMFGSANICNVFGKIPQSISSSTFALTSNVVSSTPSSFGNASTMLSTNLEKKSTEANMFGTSTAGMYGQISTPSTANSTQPTNMFGKAITTSTISANTPIFGTSTVKSDMPTSSAFNYDQSAKATTGVFGSDSKPAPNFGSTTTNNPVFGNTNNNFGSNMFTASKTAVSEPIMQSTGFGAENAPVYSPTTQLGFGRTSQAPSFNTSVATSAFGSTTAPPAFGTAQPLMGFPSSTPSMPFATTTASTAFGTMTPSSAFGTTTPSTAFGTTTPSTAFGTTTPSIAFGSTTPSVAFGTTTPSTAFRTTTQSTAFGTTTPSNAFGASSATGFGITTASQSFGTVTPSLGFGTPTPSPAFGATKPSSNFATTQASSIFGAGQSTFGSATPSGFGITQPSSTFGNATASTAFGGQPSTAFGSTPAFGSTTQSTTFGAQSSTFGGASQAPTFNTNQPAFGTASNFDTKATTNSFAKPTASTTAPFNTSTFGSNPFNSATSNSFGAGSSSFVGGSAGSGFSFAGGMNKPTTSVGAATVSTTQPSTFPFNSNESNKAQAGLFAFGGGPPPNKTAADVFSFGGSETPKASFNFPGNTSAPPFGANSSNFQATSFGAPTGTASPNFNASSSQFNGGGAGFSIGTGSSRPRTQLRAKRRT